LQGAIRHSGDGATPLFFMVGLTATRSKPLDAAARPLEP
jgi:hypothetical protein